MVDHLFRIGGIVRVVWNLSPFRLASTGDGSRSFRPEAEGYFAGILGNVRLLLQKPQAAAAIFFMLTFRFSEAQLLKLINPFLLDSKELGGLGLTTGEVGMVYGTVGIIGLTIGGIIGGIAAARGGLRKWIWPMTLSMLLTCLTFVYLSFLRRITF